MGLTKTYNHPELIVFGLNPQTAATLLHVSIYKIIEANETTNKIKIDHIYKDIATLPLKFKTVKQELAEEYLTMHKKQKFENLKALQMVWPDKSGVFPDQNGYDPKFVDAQPLLF